MTDSHIDPRMTVNEVIASSPATVAVFNAFGIDACCGGAATLEEAAQRDGAELGPLLGALERATRATQEVR